LSISAKNHHRAAPTFKTCSEGMLSNRNKCTLQDDGVAKVPVTGNHPLLTASISISRAPGRSFLSWCLPLFLIISSVRYSIQIVADGIQQKGANQLIF
jgi:hypothetical protein